MAETTLRQAENKVHIEGLLLEVRDTEWKSGKGLSIELDIETGEGEVHTVNGMSKYLKDDGSENGIAKGFKTIIEEYKSVASHGREEADKIRITSGEIRKNEYWGGDDKLRSYPQLQSNFFNRLKESDDYDPKAEFSVEVIIKAIREEIKNGEETGRVIVEALIPLFGGQIIPFEFVVNEDGSEFVQDNYEKGQTALFHGDIINYKDIQTIEKEVAFGKPKKEIKTTTIREYLITGGEEAYEEDNANAYDMELVSKALTEREVYLDGLKNNQKDKKKDEKKGGFDTKSSKKDKPKVSKDDLPF